LQEISNKKEKKKKEENLTKAFAYGFCVFGHRLGPETNWFIWSALHLLGAAEQPLAGRRVLYVLYISVQESQGYCTTVQYLSRRVKALVLQYPVQESKGYGTTISCPGE
jgi:hypothetical protein